MLAEVRKTIPTTTPKEILVECMRCSGEFNDTVCYRTATTIDFEFSDKLADLGEEEFGKRDPMSMPMTSSVERQPPNSAK